MLHFLRRGEVAAALPPSHLHAHAAHPPRPATASSAACTVSFPSPFFSTLTHDCATLLTLALSDALARLCPAIPARLTDVGSHPSLLFGPLLSGLWTSVLPFHAVLRLVDVTLMHGLHGYLTASVALAKAAEGIVRSNDTVAGCVNGMAFSWRRYSQLHAAVRCGCVCSGRAVGMGGCGWK